MKTTLLVLLAVLVSSTSSFARGGGGHGGRSSSGSHSVRSYTTKNGTHVQSHRQTNSDSSKANNWSTKGNTNPDTGKAGTK